MFLELIAVLVAGFAGAGVTILLNKVSGGILPRWSIPVAAGAVMIAVAIFNEYSWYPRTSGQLPTHVVIAETIENRAFFRPWTYIHPFVERFIAVDMASIREHANKPGMKLAEVYFIARWAPVHKIPVLMDCQGNRRAALADDVSFGDDGDISGIDWVNAADNDPILTTGCGGQ